ncbi:MAG: alkaline phosphatase family protein [Actinomycetota bacterium]|nr:alkaline phosphatase family protein [Actinomycetota bacterium]HZY66578.1 alkaline phosphatase family protein [Rubrobacteraceae bacterium]
MSIRRAEAKFSRRQFIKGVVALTAAGTAPALLLSCSREPRSDRRPEHVILVDWDGLDPAYLDRAPTPSLDELARRGSLSTARGTFPTLSNPSRASMATGAYPEVHGNAAYYLNRQTGRVVGEERTLQAETVAEALVEAGKNIVSIQWYTVQGHGVAFGASDRLYVEPGGLFAARVDAAIKVLERQLVDSGGRKVTVPKIPDFLAVYGSDLDDVGHAEGPDGPNIVPLVAEMDRQLGRLVQATRNVGIYERTAFIVTSDHGMTRWARDLTQELLIAIADTGYTPEVVTPGNAPGLATEVVIVPGAVRIANLFLRGRAEASGRRRQIERALERMPHVASVLGESDLQELQAGRKVGDLVVEAEEPWGFIPPRKAGGGTGGAHGSMEEMQVPLLFSGAGFRQDAAPRDPQIVDMAPTICALLGVRPPKDAHGRALLETVGF